MKHITSTLLATTLAFGVTLAVLPVHAETVVIKLGHQSSDNFTEMPRRGLRKGAVAQRHGEPVRRYAPVGQPPITRWDYSGFSVYFEYDRVIDSVRHRQPQGTAAP